jgi:hypothetical protein
MSASQNSLVNSRFATKTSNYGTGEVLANRALIVGISKYPAPWTALPGVAGDAKAIAEILRSSVGKFPGPGLTILLEEKATKSSIFASLQTLLLGAKQSDTILVFMAGHGTLIRKKGYFIPYDVSSNSVARSSVDLLKLWNLFDGTKCERVILILDFCRSGAVLSRGNSDDPIARTLNVMGGTGKVILAACTADEEAHESRGGPGWFTESILLGLKGAAVDRHGRITPMSLYAHAVNFVEEKARLHQKLQTPMFFGTMKGEMVLVIQLAKKSKPSDAERPLAKRRPARTMTGKPKTVKTVRAKKKVPKATPVTAQARRRPTASTAQTKKIGTTKVVDPPVMRKKPAKESKKKAARAPSEAKRKPSPKKRGSA